MSSRRFSWAVALLVSAVNLTCASTSGAGAGHPDTGVDQTSGADAQGDAPSPPCALYQYDADGGAGPPYDVVQQIFNDNCITCHAGEATLDLSAGHSWANIVGQPSPPVEACGGTLVAPGDPAGSYLYQKLTNDHPCIGSRMPRGDIEAYPLPACVTDVVRAWITAGAIGPAGATIDGG